MKNAQRDLIWSLMAFVVSVATSAYLYGGFLNPAPLLSAIYDSQGYAALGEALWSGEKLPGGSLAQRGYLYPMFATAVASVSPVLLILVQSIGAATCVFLLVRTERPLSRHVWVTPLALISASLMLAPAHIMTEAAAFTFAAAALATYILRPRSAWVVLLLVVAGLIKPAFLLVAILSGLMSLRLEKTSGIVALLVLVLVAPQLAGTYATDGRAVISNTGSANFQERYYPAVVGAVELGEFVDYKSDRAAAARALRPELSQQIDYVQSHPFPAFKTWASILWRYNFNAPSGFTQRDNGKAKAEPRARLAAASGYLNKIFVLMLVPALLGALVFFTRFPVRAWPAALIGPSIFLTAPLVYWQGDRIVFIGLLLMLPFAGLGLTKVMSGARYLVSHMQQSRKGEPVEHRRK